LVVKMGTHPYGDKGFRKRPQVTYAITTYFYVITEYHTICINYLIT
jgi:hypothetical protein